MYAAGASSGKPAAARLNRTPTNLPLRIVSDRGLPISDGVVLDAQFRASAEEIKQPDRPKLRDFSELSARFIHGIDGVNLQRKPAAR
jgi:hypothetical protein